VRREEVARRVHELAVAITDRLGVELVDVEITGEGVRTVVRVLVDREGGVSVEECARVSEMLSRQLDLEDPFHHRYTLEVSSPGLDRPLKRAGDFDRFVGRMAELVTSQPVEGQRRFVGRLGGLQAGRVVLHLPDGRELKVPLAEVAEARLRVDPEEILRDLRRKRRRGEGVDG
jgi:ribosome maturation factor RimP